MSSLFREYGRWPVDPGEARATKTLHRITPDDWKHFVNGGEKHVHLAVLGSTNYAQVAILAIPPSGYSELENHHGDEVVFVLEGKVNIRIVEGTDLQADATNTNRRHYEVNAGEAFLIPEGYVHQYINLTNRQLRLFVGIGPDF